MMEQNNIEARILEAATEVFLERGYEGTNMTLIAEAAGIGRPALYYYYRSKDRIFSEIFGNLVTSFIPGILEILRKDSPIEERIEELVDAYFEQLSRNPRLPIFLIREMDRDPQFLIQTAAGLHLEKYFLSIMETYSAESRAGHLKVVPPYSIFLNMIGGTVCPFMFKPLIESLMGKDECGVWGGASTFANILDLWKPYVVQNLKNLLIP
ncbi:MAG: TetR/AcrR family transcriptional regulator [Candidatus Cryptobacteroides sp.]